MGFRYAFISEQSRKAKAARHLYEYLKNRVQREDWTPAVEWESIQGEDGILVPDSDKPRVLNLRIQDEHLSPYMKTDLNLFQMLMLDDTLTATIYKAQTGWLIQYHGVAESPQPFGQDGFDTR